MTAEESTVKIQISESILGDSVSVGEERVLESVFLKGILDIPNGTQPCNNSCQVLGQHVETHWLL